MDTKGILAGHASANRIRERVASGQKKTRPCDRVPVLLESYESPKKQFLISEDFGSFTVGAFITPGILFAIACLLSASNAETFIIFALS